MPGFKCHTLLSRPWQYGTWVLSAGFGGPTLPSHSQCGCQVAAAPMPQQGQPTEQVDLGRTPAARSSEARGTGPVWGPPPAPCTSDTSLSPPCSQPRCSPVHLRLPAAPSCWAALQICGVPSSQHVPGFVSPCFLALHMGSLRAQFPCGCAPSLSNPGLRTSVRSEQQDKANSKEKRGTGHPRGRSHARKQPSQLLLGLPVCRHPAPAHIGTEFLPLLSP